MRIVLANDKMFQLGMETTIQGFITNNSIDGVTNVFPSSNSILINIKSYLLICILIMLFIYKSIEVECKMTICELDETIKMNDPSS